MRVHAAMVAAALGALLAGTAASTNTHAQRANRGAQSRPRVCVRFVQHNSDDGRSITFEMANRCNETVEAVVGWSVACSATSGGEPIEHVESLNPGESRSVVASADSCGAGPWRIDDVHWSWRRP